MSFHPGDKICFNPKYYVGTRNELAKKFGTGTVTSEEYERTTNNKLKHLAPYITIPDVRKINIYPEYRYVNIMWEGLSEECWDLVDLFCLVEEKRDIYTLLEEIMYD